MAVVLALALGATCTGRGRRLGVVVSTAVPFLVGLAAARDTEPVSLYLPARPCLLSGRVAGPPRVARVSASRPGASRRPDVRFALTDIRVDGVPRAGGLVLVVPGDPTVARGDSLHCLARPRRDSSWIFLRHRDHLLELIPASGIRASLDRLRHTLRRRLVQGRHRRVGRWVAALLLGERALLDGGEPESFRAVGLAHLLAISGLHVGILATLAGGLLRRVTRLGPRVRGTILAGALLLYGGLAGADPPVLRAVATGGVATLALWSDRRSSAANTLSLTFLLLAAIHGGESARAGFVLSFAAVAGIVLARPRFRRKPAPPTSTPSRLAGWARAAVRVSVGAWLGASTALVWWTPETVLWSPLLTIAASPLLAVVLTLGALDLLSCACGAPGIVATPLEALLDRTLHLLESLVHAADHLPGTPACWPAIGRISICLALASILCRFAGRPLRRLSRVLLGAAAIGALTAPGGPGANLVDLGRGQALALALEDATVLLDAGSVDRPLGGALAIRDALWGLGRRRVDLLVLSHPHADHVFALPGLLERVEVARCVLGPRFARSDIGRATLALLAAARVEIVRAAAGARLQLGSAVLEVVHPPAHWPVAPPVSINDDSLVVRVCAPGLDLLATGDLQQLGRALLSDRQVRSDVLLSPHHGRPEIGDGVFFDALAPRVLLVSCAGRLPPATTALLVRRGVPIHGTGTGGVVAGRPAPAGVSDGTWRWSVRRRRRRRRRRGPAGRRAAGRGRQTRTKPANRTALPPQRARRLSSSHRMVKTRSTCSKRSSG